MRAFKLILSLLCAICFAIGCAKSTATSTDNTQQPISQSVPTLQSPSQNLPTLQSVQRRIIIAKAQDTLIGFSLINFSKF